MLVCAACSLFWTFVYGHYSHFFHERQSADAHKDKRETDAEEYATMVRGARSMQTQAPVSQKDIDDFRSNRLGAAAIFKDRAAKAKRRETLYLHLWKWLGRVARICFLVGSAFCSPLLSRIYDPRQRRLPGAISAIRVLVVSSAASRAGRVLKRDLKATEVSVVHREWAQEHETTSAYRGDIKFRFLLLVLGEERSI